MGGRGLGQPAAVREGIIGTSTCDGEGGGGGGGGTASCREGGGGGGDSQLQGGKV